MAACIKAPKLPITTLPSPLKLQLPKIALPSLQVGVNLCCQITIPIPNPFDFIPLPPMPPGPVINIAILQVLAEAEAAINEYLDALQIDCPLEASDS